MQETNKSLISAAVLGLIFEKLNGYQDGSFYTPGFITMYMAHQTLGRAVLQHFNRRYDFGATSLIELGNCLDGKRRPEYSAHFNALTVLDPAVGSGHFLVSALNELLAIKAGLGLLLDEEGKRLPYTLAVARDELIVQNEDEAFVQYHARLDAATGQRHVSKEHTRLQSALFREKRHLMEHALFGVDLNPNSVRICRLRLWIELLKHAYYRPETGFRELETLPNLDLNVKTGNSLLSRFPLAQDLSEVFRSRQFTLATYRETVHAYFNTRDRQEKQKLLDFMRQLKEQFTQVLHKKDKKREDLRRARNQRIVLETQVNAFETPQQRETREFEMRRLELLARKLEADIDKYEQGALFRDAFEWRFEFPEVLDEQGQFRGFDVVMGNPPYLQIKKNAAYEEYSVFNTFELFAYFFEKGVSLLREGGILSFITSSLFIKGPRYELLRNLLISNFSLIELSNKGDEVFEEAKIPTAIFIGKFQSQPEQWEFADDTENQYKNLGSICNIQRGLEIGRSVMQLYGKADIDIISGSDIIKYQVLKKRQITSDVLEEFNKDTKYFQGERILIRETGSELTCVFLTEFIYCNMSLYSIKIIDENYDAKYICAVLNSLYVQKFYSKKFRSDTNIFPKIRISQARQLPIPHATPAEQAPIIALVEQVLAAKAAGEPTAALEAEIDALVAARYGLTPAEVQQLG